MADGDVTLTLRPLPDPDGVPAGRRLAGALKILLRRFRLQCVKLEPAPVAAPIAGERQSGK
jgi:hypothetical protein